ncbi:hypothetical protein CASFOL_022421 [Castilleja foliolosa]|uniref:Transmembrane protein n=1 Tax=Castilleja foliolosa TaxID=1961234 RepID=A0ABD3CVR6_9LAMI
MVYYNEYHNIKKITQVVLTLSVFAFLISQPSSLVPFLVNSYDYFASKSNFSVKLFSYTAERNYIFLLCNGILVLIIQTSGLITKITPVKLSTCYPKDVRINYGHDHVEELVDHGEPTTANIVSKVDVFEESDCVGKGGIDNPSREIEKMEKQEEKEEEIDEGLSSDELNKKCEEFIKKMKQEIMGLN